MKMHFQVGDTFYRVDLARPREISIPLNFHDQQPSVFGAPLARAIAFETEQFVGDTRQGGSCNVEEYTLIPHCNGTHTECVGHIAIERISITSTLKQVLLPATLITVEPEKAFATSDQYDPEKRKEDRLITRKNLENQLKNYRPHFLEALVIRTLPNTISKTSRDYMQHFPPYFSIEAMKLIVQLNVQHLLVDIPSVDRLLDEGKMTAHHIFWKVPAGSHEVPNNAHSTSTISEMIFVPDEIPDGNYLLNIQIPDFIADAAPSRIWLFPIEPAK